MKSRKEVNAQRMKLNPFTATSRDRATMLNSHRDSHERGVAQLQESERIFPKFQLEPEI